MIRLKTASSRAAPAPLAYASNLYRLAAVLPTVGRRDGEESGRRPPMFFFCSFYKNLGLL
jgi:hypothetical protein